MVDSFDTLLEFVINHEEGQPPVQYVSGWHPERYKVGGKYGEPEKKMETFPKHNKTQKKQIKTSDMSPVGIHG